MGGEGVSSGTRRRHVALTLRRSPARYSLMRQFAIFRTIGIRTVFVGMFDEVDEGTAIFKVTNAPPPGRQFVTYDGLPSDYYLRLTGAATRMIRGEMPLTERIPEKLAGAKY